MEDTFNQDRWDYPYSIRNGGELITGSHVTVFFEGDSLVNITGDVLPEWAGGPPPGADAESEAEEAETEEG